MEGRPLSGDSHALTRAVLLAAGLLVLGLLFAELVTLLVAILITILVAIPITAAATWLEGHGVPRPIGALLALVALVGVVAGLIAAILPTFIDQANQFIDDVPGIVNDLEREVGDITGDEPSEVSDKIEDYLNGIGDNPERLIGPVTDTVVSLAGALAFVILGLITAYYIAVRPRPLIDGALLPLPARAPDVGARSRRPDPQCLDRLVQGGDRRHAAQRPDDLHRAQPDRPRLCPRLRGARGPAHRGALLRTDRRQPSADPLRARRLSREGAPGRDRLHRRPADRGQSDDSSGDVPDGQAPPPR